MAIAATEDQAWRGPGKGNNTVPLRRKTSFGGTLVDGRHSLFLDLQQNTLTSNDWSTSLSTLDPQDGVSTPTYLHKILRIVWVEFTSHGVGIKKYFTENGMKDASSHWAILNLRGEAKQMLESWRTDSTRVLERKGYAGRESDDVATWGRGNKKELSRLMSAHVIQTHDHGAPSHINKLFSSMEE